MMPQSLLLRFGQRLGLCLFRSRRAEELLRGRCEGGCKNSITGVAMRTDVDPAIHQGTRIVSAKEAIPNLHRVGSEEHQRRELQLLRRLNHQHRKLRSTDSRLVARMQSFETAFGMQRALPDVLDLSQETAATLRLYGLG